MRVLGREALAQWPGFDDGDLLGGFRRLLDDLRHCEEFLNGNAAKVAAAAKALAPERGGLQRLHY
ncbi:hypothetical protein [Sandarakinorhabdus oryzae]|uniref:hypothetical protein n=1 Tax=Sandarakinorhabdus oryzae TaxID=2675220 RepID=UPI0012E111D5|nr:hypothetical protein [Sandarakinorhabdus oryzae]